MINLKVSKSNNKKSKDNSGQLIRYGDIDAIWNANNTKILKFQQEIWHNGLKEHKVITSPDKNILKNKVRVQVDNWMEKWDVLCEKKRIEDIKRYSIDEATNRTKKAEEILEEVENILLSGLEVNTVLDWEILKNKDAFKVPCPTKPCELKLNPIPTAPNENSVEFQPKLNFLSNMFKFLGDKVILESQLMYKRAYENWQKNNDEIVRNNVQLTKEYDKNMDDFNKKLTEWNVKKSDYVKKQNELNGKIDEVKARYLDFDTMLFLNIVKWC